MPRRNNIPKFLTLAAALLCAASALTISAQDTFPRPERLTHVAGIVVKPDGTPLIGVAVTLERDGKPLHSTTTDAAGAFEFRNVHGQFVFRVARTQFAPAMREVIVDDELVVAAERKKLYVIAGPGACEDECSEVLTSKHDFENALKKLNRHKGKE
jgi:hypothetical protein